MGKKILNALTNNLVYKILAVVLGFVLWLVVYNLNDPDVTKTFTATIEQVNGNSIKEQNYYFEINEGSTVEVAVTGKRSIINNLSDSGFTAKADLSKVDISKLSFDEDGTAVAEIPLSFKSDYYNNSLSITSTSETVHVSLEQTISTSFNVEVETVGELQDGYAVGDKMITAPEAFYVSGPKSVVNTIDRVVATVNLSNRDVQSSDYIIDYVVPKFYDAEGNVIDTKKLEYTGNNNKVTAKIMILNEKTVPLNFSYKGKPANGLSVKRIVPDVESVAIKGSKEDINLVNSIDIPAEVIDVTGLSESFTKVIDISAYLPEGISLSDGIEPNITVSIEIETYETKTYVLNVSDINVLNLKDEYTINFSDSTYTITVRGIKSKLDVLTTDMLIASIDVKGRGIGSYSSYIEFDISDDYTIADLVRITYEIAEKNTDDEI